MPDDDATTAQETPTPGPNPRLGGFTRSRRDRMIGGVAGGLAERLDVDPLVVRAAFVILAVAGGSGILLYLLGWLLLPEEGDQESIAGHALGTRSWDSQRTRHAMIAVLIAVAFFGVIRPWHWFFGRTAVIFIAVVMIAALSRHRHSAPASPPSGFAFHGPGGGVPPSPLPPYPFPPGESPGSDATLTDLGGVDTEGRDQVGPDPTIPFSSSSVAAGTPTTRWFSPSVLREPSLIPMLLAGLAVLVAVSAVIAATGWVSVPLPAVVAVALLMSLAALVAGAQRRRFLGAILISLPLAGLFILSTAVPHPLAGGVGERTWHPADASQLKSSYRLGTGQATLDLSNIDLTSGPRAVRASVGDGDLSVTVPAGAVVQVRQRAAIGSAEVFGDRQGGVSVDRTSIDPSGKPSLNLDLQVGIGSIEVRRAAA